MPQEKTYTIQLNDSTLIEYDPEQVPAGFDTLSPNEQKAYIRQGINEYNANREKEKNASAGDIIWPAAIVIVLSLIILYIAKKIRDHPKIYDSVVKLDGKPNPRGE